MYSQNSLKNDEKLEYDQRTFKVYFWDNLIETSDIFKIMFKKSLIIPFGIVVTIFSDSLISLFALNALFFYEKDIENKHSNEELFNMVIIIFIN